MHKCLVFLYQREKIDKEDDKLLFQFTPLDIIEGSMDENDYFRSTDNKYGLNIIDNILAKDDELVFGFPFDIDGYSEEDINECKESLKSDKLFEVPLFQIYDKDTLDSHAETFAYINACDAYVLIPDNYYTSSALLYNQDNIEKYKKQNNVKHIKVYAKDGGNQQEQLVIKEKKEETEEKKKTFVKSNTSKIYSDELYEEIRKNVLCQDEQIKRITSIFAKNQRINNLNLKSNFILCGPTGVGKSEIFRNIAKITEIPMITEDANEYTASGYVGKTVTDMLTHLLNVADGDVEKAQKGIIVVDEIDKKGGNDLEVTKGAVIQSLLKMIEGHKYEMTFNKKRVLFDTSKLTFAFCGAFSDIKNQNDKKKNIGFGIQESEVNNSEIYNEKTLSKFLLPEFVGRNRIIVMNNLEQKDLERILRESKISYLKLYRDYLKENGINFIYDDEVITAIAKKAIELETGARSLQSISEQAIYEADYYITSKDANFSELIITKDTIEDNKKFILR